MSLRKNYDIIYFNLYSSYYDKIPKPLRYQYIGRNFLNKCKRVITTIGIDVWNILVRKRKLQSAYNSDWIIVDAINNLQSVNEIFRNNDAGILFFTYSSRLARANTDVFHLRFPGRIWYFFKMMFYVLKRRKRIGNRWDFFLTEYGWYETASGFLKDHKPASILFTNDHTPVNRAMMLAARKIGIKTGYIQHACVRDDFGELLVSHAFLDGQDSVDKYAAFGNRFNTKVHLIGMPKLSKYLHLRSQSGQLNTIGIAFNITDDLNEVLLLAQQLKEAKFKIIIRPHPKDKRIFPVTSNIETDDPSKSVFDFLSRIDALVAGESSIHVESILLNKPSFQFDFNQHSCIHDLYGFLKNGLVKEYKIPEQLLADIHFYNSAPFNVYEKGAYYDSMVDDKNEPLADKIAFKLIEKTLLMKDAACVG